MSFPRGAEAIVSADRFLGRSVVRKDRVPKAYRHPHIDALVRDERTRDEANLLLAARRAGVPVPVVYEVDRSGAAILMEHLDGPTLRSCLAQDDARLATRRLQQLGRIVARLHNAGLTHGDLTTSNVIVVGDALVLIDFGLGQATQETEPRGVDLHLVEEALASTDGRAEALFAAFLDAYLETGPAPAVARLDDIRQRGRYR